MSLAIVNNAHTNGNPVPDATNSTGSQTGNAENNPASMNIEETGIHGTPRHSNKSRRKTRDSSAHIDPVDGDGSPSRDRRHSSISVCASPTPPPNNQEALGNPLKHADYDSSDSENSGEGGTHMMRNRTVLPLHNSGNDDENPFIDRQTRINAASQQFIIRQPRLFATHPPETSSGGCANEHGSAHPAGQLNKRLSGLNLSREQLNAVLAALAPAPSSNVPPLSTNSQDRAGSATPTQEQSWPTYAMQILRPTNNKYEKPIFLPALLAPGCDASDAFRQQSFDFGVGITGHLLRLNDPVGKSWTICMLTSNQDGDAPDLENHILFTIKNSIYHHMPDLRNAIARASLSTKPTPEKVLDFADTLKLVRQPYKMKINKVNQTCWILYGAPISQHGNIFAKAAEDNAIKSMIHSPKSGVYEWAHMQVYPMAVECTLCKVDDHPTFQCPYMSLDSWYGTKTQVVEMVKAVKEEETAAGSNA
ncbi:hypothetical protein BT96DRAFT_1000319 [Gymnopus androsaceus JB14]|uniref:Uncharacterized protein n=1 Tax=Gymnopus androsaceus JB14 TaxID=1447944 RepID=A0A6A4H3U0_9AGAR|nr:hypothetical protein BT96DRAFT_1000319 [Gymnopus androsaceus JB14]